jgi:hypothetical protein
MKKKCQTMKMMTYRLLWNQKRMKLEEIILGGDFLACHQALRKCKQLEKAKSLLLLKQPFLLQPYTPQPNFLSDLVHLLPLSAKTLKHEFPSMQMSAVKKEP